MTALQAAKAECANCDSAGNCAGIGIRLTGNNFINYIFRDLGRCWLAPDSSGKIRPCKYFEEYVAPLPGRMLADKELRQPRWTARRKYAERLAEGVRAYEMAVMAAPTLKYAKCKRCQRQVHPPKRLCAQCAKNSTLKAKRQWWSKTRKMGLPRP
jgi:hypothetical protein